MRASVEIDQSGRGGTIRYREESRSIRFDWEFAASPALALVWGPKRADWESAHPWAAGRQQEIYDTVGEEILRQKARGCTYEHDLERGELTILERSG